MVEGMVSIERMEKKYNVCIVDDSFYHPIRNQWVTRYKIYTADGCQWENGLTYRSLQKECREHAEIFKRISDRVKEVKIC